MAVLELSSFDISGHSAFPPAYNPLTPSTDSRERPVAGTHGTRRAELKSTGSLSCEHACGAVAAQSFVVFLQACFGRDPGT